MEVSEVRRRLRAAIETAKRNAADRRSRADEASRVWSEVLAAAVVPAFHAVAAALSGEGHRFKVSTPGEAARLSPERSSEEFVELALDTARDVPAAIVRSTRGRGRRMLSSERPVREGTAIGDLTQEAVVGILLDELIPFIER